MSEPLVLVERTVEGVCVITLNRPSKRNALNIPLLRALCNALTDPQNIQRVIVLRGNGPVFCAGLDLREALEEETAYESSEYAARAMELVMRAPVVTIAAVHGAALAGGAGLMLACDFSVVAEDATIGFPEVRRGLVASFVMTFLRRKVGEQKARELVLLGDSIPAREAERAGMVTRVVSENDLEKEAMKIADRVLKNAPGAIRRSKTLLEELWHTPVSEHLEHARKLHRHMRTSVEAKEGLNAFFERRPPNWEYSGTQHDLASDSKLERLVSQ